MIRGGRVTFLAGWVRTKDTLMRKEYSSHVWSGALLGAGRC